MKKSFLTLMTTVAILSSSPLLAMKEENEVNNASSAAQLKKTKDPIEMPKTMSIQLLEQIIEDGYLNTTEGRFEFLDTDISMAKEIHHWLTQGLSKVDLPFSYAGIVENQIQFSAQDQDDSFINYLFTLEKKDK